MPQPSPALKTLAALLCIAGLAGCASDKPVYSTEAFHDTGTFSRNFAAPGPASCEAARRALLSQGYVIAKADGSTVNGAKSFQEKDKHFEIVFHISCSSSGADGKRATVFANALLDRYALKKTNNSASVGVGVLGSLSMPFTSGDDSLIKVASETINEGLFYDRFFGLQERFLGVDASDTEIETVDHNALPVPQALSKAATAPADDKADAKSAARPEVKPEAKPEAKPDTAPQAAPAGAPAPVEKDKPAS